MMTLSDEVPFHTSEHLSLATDEVIVTAQVRMAVQVSVPIDPDPDQHKKNVARAKQQALDILRHDPERFALAVGSVPYRYPFHEPEPETEEAAETA